MTIAHSFSLAQERYAALGVDVDHALKTLATIPLSLHCWQGDDVSCFENMAGLLTLEPNNSLLLIEQP